MGDHSPFGHKGECTDPANLPTPAPTLPGTAPCTESDWTIVQGLNHMKTYEECIDQLGCWNGVHQKDKDCWATCLQHVQITSPCSVCVVDRCPEGECDKCAPTG